MTDREQALGALAERSADRDDVHDAWLAKSFTDLLLVLEVPEGEPVPDDLAATLEERNLVGYNDVHDVSAEDGATAGTLDDRDRYRFVDLRSRGTQQSYVIE